MPHRTPTPRTPTPRTPIATKNAPQAIGTYSQAMAHGSLLFISGQIPLTPSGELISGTIEEEIIQCFTNLNAIAEEAGSSLQNAVKITIFLTNLDHFAALNVICEKFLVEPFPARACVQVAALPKNVRVEIDAIVALNTPNTPNT